MRVPAGGVVGDTVGGVAEGAPGGVADCEAEGAPSGVAAGAEGAVAVSGFSGCALTTDLTGTGLGAGAGAGLAVTALAAMPGAGWQAFSAASNRCQLSRITSGQTPLVMWFGQ